MEALDRRASLGAEVELRVARASLFAAQAIARRLIADGREEEVQGNPRIHLRHRE